jgi:hypothetical protein
MDIELDHAEEKEVLLREDMITKELKVESHRPAKGDVS